MSEARARAFRVHEDPVLFREAVSFTAAETGFSARLIEKDYFCSVLLAHWSLQADNPLVFKGGTCLAKIHAGFYRLSEDLDFAIPVSVDAKRRDRSKMAVRVKARFTKLPTELPCFKVNDTLEGRDESKQYMGSLAYNSVLTGQEEILKLDVSLREPHLLPTIEGKARTILSSPVSGRPMIPEFTIRAIAVQEAFAEKIRAALTRPEPAIRDFYDLDYATRHLGLRLDDLALAELIREKLAVPGTKIRKFNDELHERLRLQIEARLKPVLRDHDYSGFTLEKCFQELATLSRRRR